MTWAAFLLCLKVIAICLAISDDSLEQTPTHSIPSTEEAGRIGRYLSKIILHQLFVAECAVPRNAHTPHSGSFSLIPNRHLLEGIPPIQLITTFISQQFLETAYVTWLAIISGTFLSVPFGLTHHHQFRSWFLYFCGSCALGGAISVHAATGVADDRPPRSVLKNEL
jgi:hypothetical protein